MRYAVVTFGCRVNQADSLRIEEDLRRRGAREAAPADADVVVVNTCSVTATADQGARQTIRRIARDNPAARIVVTGCYATREPGDLEHLPNVVRLVTNADKDRLVEQCLGIRTRSDDGRAVRVWRRTLRRADRARPRRPDRLHAARPDRLRGALRLLHHPHHQGRRPQPAD